MAYATQSDLFQLGLPQGATGSAGNPSQVPSAAIDAALQATSETMDSYFRGRWGMNALPLLAWDNAVRRCNAQMAAYDVMVVRGFSSDAESNEHLRLRNKEAIEWLQAVQRQQAHPLVTLANGQTAVQQPNLVSSSVVNVISGATAPNRGW